MEIKDNLFEINKEIEEICKHNKRRREDITLIAVSKGRSLNTILKLNNNNHSFNRIDLRAGRRNPVVGISQADGDFAECHGTVNWAAVSNGE